MRDFLQKLIGASGANGIERIADRFLQAFEAHGIQPSQIPRFITTLSFNDLRDRQTLLAALNHRVLKDAADFLGIRLEWLEGVDDQIYPLHYCYKSPERFFVLFNTLKHGRNDCPVRVVASNKQLDYRRHDEQKLVLVVLEPIAEIGEDENIYRYHIFSDGWDWRHQPCRMDLKAIVKQLLKQQVMTVPIFEAPSDVIEKITNGEIFPADYVSGCLCTDPSLEDYVLTPDQSAVSKESEELPAVEAYLKECNLDLQITMPVDQSEPSVGIDAGLSRHAASEKSRKAALQKSAPGQQIKQRFIATCKIKLQRGAFVVAEVARDFYDDLDETDAIKLFRSSKDFDKLTPDEARINATRTLVRAWSDYKKTTDPTTPAQ